jgi:hypothetical protein
MTAKPTSRMTEAARERARAQISAGADDLNPEFLYSTTHTTLLLAIEAGLIDAAGLARSELASRGLDANGDWCGFERAQEIHLGAAAETASKTAIAEIARRLLHLDTLESRNSDSLDFHELAVWQVKEALLVAFAAGQAAAR